jgi:Lon-like protease
VLYVAPSDRYIFLPDEARPLEARVEVENEKPDANGGGIYYVAVDVRKASILEKIFPGLYEGATLEPVANVLAEGEDEKAHRRCELAAMRRSQEYATAVALRALEYRVRTKRLGVAIEGTFGGYPASGKLQGCDLIRTVDGTPVRQSEDVTRVLGRKQPGDTVRLVIEREGKRRDLALETVPDPRHPTRAFVGISVAEVFDVLKLPVEVSIDLGQVGGPSAGLAFALDVMEELGRDVDRGNRVAASGEIFLDGTVAKVGGIKQKTIGARRSDMDVFLVPGDNAAEARRHAKGLRIIPVDSFQQALQALATLPRKR